MLGEGAGDGVVTVESALHPCVVSQRFVDATHTEVQHHPDTQAEIRAILQAHLVESGLNANPLTRAKAAATQRRSLALLPAEPENRSAASQARQSIAS
jgi:hypothetical protein